MGNLYHSYSTGIPLTLAFLVCPLDLVLLVPHQNPKNSDTMADMYVEKDTKSVKYLHMVDVHTPHSHSITYGLCYGLHIESDEIF